MNSAELESRLAAYIAIRQAMGYGMRAERTLLVNFVRFLAERDALSPIRAQAAFDWATQESGQRGVAGKATRLTMARRFLLHVRATYPDTEIPARYLVASARRPTPYLFTEGEVTQLLEACHQAGPRHSLRPHTLATLITLLDSTGLRVGEAVHLSIDDVVLAAQPRLLIRDTKFGKSRFVPLHSTTATMLARYAAERKRLAYDGLSDAFFVSERGTALRVSSLGRWFGQLVIRVGL